MRRNSAPGNQTDAPLLLAVGRTAGGLVVYASVRDEGGFRIDAAPWESAPVELRAEKVLAGRAWKALREFSPDDGDGWFDLAVVLVETVVEVTAEPLAPLPESWFDAPPERRATAAHPRAFRGTKYQPPKSRQRSPVDLRPYTCHPRFLRLLMTQLLARWEAVRARLVEAGYADPELGRLEAELRGRRWASDPLEGSRGQAALARLVKLAGRDAAEGWVRASEAIPEALRVGWFETVLDLEAWRRLRPEPLGPCVREVVALATEEQLAGWLTMLLRHAEPLARREYLMAGFRLAAQFAARQVPEPVGEVDAFPEAEVVEIAAVTGEDGLALDLWAACGHLPGLNDFIRSPEGRTMDGPSQKAWWRLLANLMYHDLSPRRHLAKWNAVRAQVPALLAEVTATPEAYRGKAIAHLAEWFWWWEDPKTIRRGLGRAPQLLRRLCAPPLAPQGDGSWLLRGFLELPEDHTWEDFLRLPVDCLVAFERVGRRSNEARRVAHGFRRLLMEAPELVLAGLTRARRALLRCAAVLAGLPPLEGRELMRACGRTPLFALDPSLGDLRETCAVLSRELPATATDPVPARLKAWARGEIELTGGQVARFRRVLAERMTGVRLAVIEAAALEWLGRGLVVGTPDSAEERHALRLVADVDDNRRVLRRFLREYWRGNRDWVARHPANEAWYARHPRVPRARWESGVEWTGRLEDGRPLVIRVEREPLEVLKLGTYVGSCLGLGGLLSYSAVAAAVDANKRVLYARDAKGRVVARQLVALARDERLVCFEVYPAAAPAGVKKLFREYDRAFAEWLGVPLFTRAGEEDDYEIETVVARHWWDDYALDFTAEEADSCTLAPGSTDARED